MISLLTRNDFDTKLGKLLETEHRLPRDRYKQLVQEARNSQRHVIEVLFERDVAPHHTLVRTVASHFGTPPVLLKDKVIVSYVLNLIPQEVADAHSVIIFKKLGNRIHVATSRPDNGQTIDFIRKKTGFEPKVYFTSPPEIRQALKRYQEELSDEFSRILDRAVRETRALREPAERIAYNVPIVRMVDAILEQALTRQASDVHLESGSGEITIRFRVDGLLKKIVTLPRDVLAPLITRLKIMSNLKIDEHRLPQDGRFKYAFQDREVAVRASIIPTLYGPKAVLRLLDMKERDFTLPRLGLNAHHYETLRDEIKKPQGMILVTGPTGSGKTTTLYALLRMLNREDVNISTIEDPIEYGIDGINQTQINPAAGLRFANGLRSLLRQDPNIIMVGEIRDTETADISMNAAMTGHLVLSTLHTNSAFQALERLVEMDVQPYVAASVTNVVIGQRLVRRICPDCRTRLPSTPKALEQYRSSLPIEPTLQKLNRLGLIRETSALALNFFRGAGCAKCNGSGYRGRQGIYELLPINKNLYDLMLRTPTADAVYEEAMRQGLLTMAEDGLLKVFQGMTTFDEILRVTKE